MYNLLTPLARVRLSEHYTTMYRSLRIEENGIQPIYLDQIRNLTETPTLANRYIVYRFKRLKRSFMIQFVLKIVYMRLAVLYLFILRIVLVSQFNWPCYVFLT